MEATLKMIENKNNELDRIDTTFEQLEQMQSFMDSHLLKYETLLDIGANLVFFVEDIMKELEMEMSNEGKQIATELTQRWRKEFKEQRG